MALGALEVLRGKGIDCPADIHLVGYNDTQMTAYTEPPLTTVEFPGYEIGRLAADTAVALIDDPARARVRVSLPPALVERTSTLG